VIAATRAHRQALRHHACVLPAHLIIAAIPKNGTRTILGWAAELLGQDPYRPKGMLLHAYFQGPASLAALPPRARRRVIASATRIVYLREPIARVVSAYLDKFVEDQYDHPSAWRVCEAAARARGERTGRRARRLAHTPAGQRSRPVLAGVDYDRGITFAEFVDHLCRTPDHALNEHWRPQARSLLPGRYTFVGRTEDMSATLPAVAHRLGLPPPSPDILGDGRTTRHRPDVGVCLADIPSGVLRREGVRASPRDLLRPDLAARLRARFDADLRLYAALPRHEILLCA
jgi:hypothetical protein